MSAFLKIYKIWVKFYTEKLKFELLCCKIYFNNSFWHGFLLVHLSIDLTQKILAVPTYRASHTYFGIAPGPKSNNFIIFNLSYFHNMKIYKDVLKEILNQSCRLFSFSFVFLDKNWNQPIFCWQYSFFIKSKLGLLRQTEVVISVMTHQWFIPLKAQLKKYFFNSLFCLCTLSHLRGVQKKLG